MKVKFVDDTKKNKETYSYRGWLISDSFLKRTLAIVFYYTIGQLSLILIAIIIILIINLII